MFVSPVIRTAELSAVDGYNRGVAVDLLPADAPDGLIDTIVYNFGAVQNVPNALPGDFILLQIAVQAFGLSSSPSLSVVADVEFGDSSTAVLSHPVLFAIKDDLDWAAAGPAAVVAKTERFRMRAPVHAMGAGTVTDTIGTPDDGAGVFETVSGEPTFDVGGSEITSMNPSTNPSEVSEQSQVSEASFMSEVSEASVTHESVVSRISEVSEVSEMSEVSMVSHVSEISSIPSISEFPSMESEIPSHPFESASESEQPSMVIPSELPSQLPSHMPSHMSSELPSELPSTEPSVMSQHPSEASTLPSEESTMPSEESMFSSESMTPSTEPSGSTVVSEFPSESEVPSSATST